MSSRKDFSSVDLIDCYRLCDQFVDVMVEAKENSLTFYHTRIRFQGYLSSKYLISHYVSGIVFYTGIPKTNKVILAFIELVIHWEIHKLECRVIRVHFMGHWPTEEKRLN